MATLEDWLDGRPTARPTTAELLETVLKKDRGGAKGADAKALASIMRRLGYRSVRGRTTGNRRTRVWARV